MLWVLGFTASALQGEHDGWRLLHCLTLATSGRDLKAAALPEGSERSHWPLLRIDEDRATLCIIAGGGSFTYRERVGTTGGEIKTVRRAKRLARIDADHKTKASVKGLAENLLQPLNRVARYRSSNQLTKFADSRQTHNRTRSFPRHGGGILSATKAVH
jgi:hypothetical protein